jgi:hypothetical protein
MNRDRSAARLLALKRPFPGPFFFALLNSDTR